MKASNLIRKQANSKNIRSSNKHEPDQDKFFTNNLLNDPRFMDPDEQYGKLEEASTKQFQGDRLVAQFTGQTDRSTTVSKLMRKNNLGKTNLKTNDVDSFNSHSSSDISGIRDRIVKEYDRKRKASIKGSFSPELKNLDGNF